MKTGRSYTMRARAASAEATRRRILEATGSLLRHRFRSEIRLEEIASDAGVSAQTVLNVFGSRAALLDEAVAEMRSALRAQRLLAEPGDVAGGISVLLDHYEAFGDIVLRNLAEEADMEWIEAGRASHRQWVVRQFSPLMTGLDGAERRLVTDALVCACDVYTWKLLRRDMGRTRPQTQATMLRMVASILEHA
jgi:AcrR family transcriptional regulator